MKTLIELYDERPLENVLATEVFRPERTVFLCSKEILQNGNPQKQMQSYFRHRGLAPELVFLEASLFHADKILRMLESVIAAYPDCAIDITGGSDAALFAVGQLCASSETPVFTYSRKQNRFFSIHNAPFAERLDCALRYQVDDCFLMAGGAVQRGRVDNGILKNYLDLIDPFFALYLRHRRSWNRIVTYIQRVSQAAREQRVSLSVNAPYTVNGERGQRIPAPEQALRDLQTAGLIRALRIVPGESVSFRFADQQVRTWLRDVGSVLELYIYKACLDAGVFQDVRTSVVVSWEGAFGRDAVSNELDVVAVRGIMPLFISCKTCPITTEALNELAILRDRFGGAISRAAVVTAESCRAITRHRASELDIDIIDLEDLEKGTVRSRLLTLAGC